MQLLKESIQSTLGLPCYDPPNHRVVVVPPSADLKVCLTPAALRPGPSVATPMFSPALVSPGVSPSCAGSAFTADDAGREGGGQRLAVVRPYIYPDTPLHPCTPPVWMHGSIRPKQCHVQGICTGTCHGVVILILLSVWCVCGMSASWCQSSEGPLYQWFVPPGRREPWWRRRAAMKRRK